MRTFFIITFLALITSDAAAQQRSVVDTFTFSIVPKTEAHPYFGIGHDFGYAVNGVESPTLYLLRDSLYSIHYDTLDVLDIPQFYTKPIGGGRDFYPEVRISDDRKSQMYFIRMESDMPDTLYYASGAEPWMGGTVIAVDSLPSSVHANGRRAQSSPVVLSSITPNPVQNYGVISFAAPHVTSLQVQIVDVAGRVIRDWSYRPSSGSEVSIPIDREGLPSGVYFYRVLDPRAGGTLLTSGTLQIR